MNVTLHCAKRALVRDKSRLAYTYLHNICTTSVGKLDFNRYRRIGYNLNVMRQSAYLVFNPIMVDNYAAFFNCTPVGRASDSMMAPTLSYSFKLVGAGDSCLLLGPPGSNWCFSFAPELVGYSAPRDLHRRAAYSICESWFMINQDVYHDLFVCS